MKSITIIGNLGANAVTRVTSDGRQLMSFNVAVNQSNNEPLWFNCIGNLREKLLPYLLKGQCVCIIGDLNPRIYNGQLDMSISVDKCELCGAKQQENSQESATPVTSFDADQQQTL